MNPYTGLVLAGRRSSRDPLAESQGGTHRALLDVVGVPLLVRVLRALRAARHVDGLAVSIDDLDALDSLPELHESTARGEIIHHQSLSSPSRSVRDALEGPLADHRVLVTTADHALLTAEIIDHFAQCADRSDADLAIGVVTESVVRQRYPSATRTYLRFRDGGFSGANLFAFRTPVSLLAAKFWVNAEQLRKRPWRLISVFGPAALLLYALRRLSFDAALKRASISIGCRVRAIPLPFPEAAIDVDHPSDLALVSKILTERERTPQPEGRAPARRRKAAQQPPHANPSDSRARSLTRESGHGFAR